MFSTTDTIVAVASARGGAARGIVRASGDRVIDCLRSVFRCDDPNICVEDLRHARRVVGAIALAGLSHPLDAALYLWPTARSFTRQPTAELHTIGSPPLLDAIVAALTTAGAPPARPGEFTLRAFLAGRIDLTQAEAVLGVIDATGQRDLDVALAQLAGGLATSLQQLRDKLADLLAELEAGLDFVEEDIEFISAEVLASRLDAAQQEVESLLGRLSGRATSDELPRVVLTGAANAGKSSLFNALVGHGRAIVSETPGTTRDYLVARIDLDGVACELVDTAGLGEPRDPIDHRAQQATHEQGSRAHVLLDCFDATMVDRLAPGESPGANDTISTRLTVWTKVDMASVPSGNGISTSAATSLGLDTLRTRLRQVLLAARSLDADVVPSTASRARASLERAATSIARAQRLASDRHGEELIAAELRGALDALGEVVGAVYTDDILDRIFSRFCIGK